MTDGKLDDDDDANNDDDEKTEVDGSLDGETLPLIDTNDETDARTDVEEVDDNDCVADGKAVNNGLAEGEVEKMIEADGIVVPEAGRVAVTEKVDSPDGDEDENFDCVAAADSEGLFDGDNPLGETREELDTVANADRDEFIDEEYAPLGEAHDERESVVRADREETLEGEAMPLSDTSGEADVVTDLEAVCDKVLVAHVLDVGLLDTEADTDREATAVKD